MILTLQSLKEDKPGEKWQALFNKAWPFYRHWFLSEGVMARKGYLSSYSMLELHMPELLPVYDTLTRLAGGGDLEARFLSMYCPPPYMTGCSQMACNHSKVYLIRNYDFNPNLFEGYMLCTNWLKPVIGMSDCTWGLLDGMNADGLAVSLSFGGRQISGEGFGIPLIIRYLLETTVTVKEAVEKLKNIPAHMAYNVTLADISGDIATVYLSPDRQAVITNSPVATNHQEAVEWPQYATLTATVERKQAMETLHAHFSQNEELVTSKFLSPPLFAYHYEKSFGTLYTINYQITDKQIKIHWPHHATMVQSFEHFRETITSIHLPVSNKSGNII